MRLNRLLTLILSLIMLAAPLGAAPALAQGKTAPAPAAEKAAAGTADVELLLRVLQDEAARARLIEALRAEKPAVAPSALAPEPLRNEIAKGLTSWTRGAGEQGVALIEGLNQAAAEALKATEAAARFGQAAIAETFIVLGATIALAFGLLWLARGLLARIFLPVQTDRPVLALARRILAALVELTAGAVAIMIAVAGGFVLLALLGPGNLLQAAGAGFLAAFAITEAVKLIVRATFAPAYPTLRLLPVSDTSANYWTIWLSRVIVVLVYPVSFVAPALARAGLPEIAQAIVVLTVATVAVIGVALVLQNRAAVRERLDERARALGGGGAAHLYILFGRTWHALAVMLIIALAFLSLTQPERAVGFVLASTLESVVIIALGRAALLFISRALGGGMTLPGELRERLPLLEGKLNAFVPAIMKIVRLVIIALVVAAVARAWGAFDAYAWLATPVGVLVVASLISTGLVVVIGLLAYIVVTSWIEYRLNPAFGTAPGQRERTILALFRSAFTVALAVIVAMMALSELGVNIGPLLAGAGVVGLAIGFGAQKLVQDVINGVFIQLENVMNEGDVVTAGGVSGVVEKLTIRSVGLRDLNGAYHSIPFSAVDRVTNMMKNFSFYVADVGVAYRENIGEVKAALTEAFDRFADSAVIVRCRIKTLPGKQWPTGRAFNERIKEVFDERGIEIPFPHVTLYAGQDRNGAAPPLRIAGEGAPLPPAAPATPEPESAATRGQAS